VSRKPPPAPEPLDAPVVPEAPIEAATAEGLVLILDEMRRRAHARYWTTKRRSVGNTDPVLRLAGAKIAALDDVIAAVSSYLSAGTAGAGTLFRHSKVVGRCPRCRARARLNPATVGYVRRSPTVKAKEQALNDQTLIVRSPDPVDPYAGATTELDELPF
jgi:hypothetical protein